MKESEPSHHPFPPAPPPPQYHHHHHHLTTAQCAWTTEQRSTEHGQCLSHIIVIIITVLIIVIIIIVVNISITRTNLSIERYCLLRLQPNLLATDSTLTPMTLFWDISQTNYPNTKSVCSPHYCWEKYICVLHFIIYFVSRHSMIVPRYVLFSC